MAKTGAELKVSLAGKQVAAALAALSLDSADDEGLVGFFEDRTVGTNLPLFHAGVILRVRGKVDKRAESTVKFRPARASQLPGKWLDPTSDVRLEQDWGLSSPLLAAALDHKGDAKLSASPGAVSVADFFGDAQLDFLADGSPLRINVAELTLLGPVATKKWESVVVSTEHQVEVEVERWTIDELDFLELSTKVKDAAQAPAAQQRLLQAIADIGLTVDTAGASKTETVLNYLAGKS